LRCMHAVNPLAQLCPCEELSDNRVFHAWSRHFVDEHGAPLRRSMVTGVHRSLQAEDANEDIKGGHVRCPGCSIRLHKDSACNELRHCPEHCVCYSCGAQSLPWENGLPSSHWKECPRWDSQDHVAAMAGFLCVEGDCYGEGVGECTRRDHAEGIQAYHVARKLRCLQAT
jgi:hypothetical protein